MTTQEQLTTLRALPSRSKTPLPVISKAVYGVGSMFLQSPAHSPSCFPSGTLINGILCSEQSAMTNFLYASSSHASLRIQTWAWRRSRAVIQLAFTYDVIVVVGLWCSWEGIGVVSRDRILNIPFDASRRPRARPSWIKAVLRQDLSASRTEIDPPEVASALTSTSSSATTLLVSSASDIVN